MLFHSLFLLFFSLPSFSTQDKQIWKYDEVHKLNYLSNGSVIKGKKINNPIKIINLQKNFFVEESRDFKPTIIQGKQEALKIFERLRSNYTRKSECSDRAHIWAYDEFINHQIFSQKIFIFFTASYINKHSFKWWFHVAPMIKVQENNSIQEYVLDYRYAHEPLLLKDWSDLMVHSKRSCKWTTKFSEYDINPQTEDCYFIKESMYYRLPSDLSFKETHQQFKTEFRRSEINYSLSQAFEK